MIIIKKKIKNYTLSFYTWKTFKQIYKTSRLKSTNDPFAFTKIQNGTNKTHRHVWKETENKKRTEINTTEEKVKEK